MQADQSPAHMVDTGVTRKGYKLPRWRSARELLMKLNSTVPDIELRQSSENFDAVLNEILNTWPKLSLHILPAVFLSKLKASLAASLQKLENMGFGRYVHGLRTEAVASVARWAAKNGRAFSVTWRLDDFELVLEAWSGLEDGARKWLAKQFLAFWQSSSGEAELRSGATEDHYGTTLLHFKAIWSYGGAAPRMLQLDPAKAIGLRWNIVQVEELLRDFVDVNGDCIALVEDLQKSGQLRPTLVSEHEGLLSACIDVCPDFVVGKMLVGEICLQDRPAKQGTAVARKRTAQASLVLRLVKAAAEVVAGWGGGAVPQLTDQQAKHLTHLLTHVVGSCADKSIAMFQAQEHIVELTLCLGKKQGLAQMLRQVSRFYIGRTRALDFSEPAFNSYVARVGECGSRRALVAVSKEERAASPRARADREVDSFSSLLSYLLSHTRALDMDTLVQLETCRDKVVDDALRRQLHAWTLREVSGAVRDVREDGSEEGRCYAASTLRSWLQHWVRPICDAAQTCEVFTAMAEGLGSWLFVLQVAGSLGRVPFAERPPEEQALVECVYQVARRRVAACGGQLPCRAVPGSGVDVSPRDAVLKSLSLLHPQQFAEDFDARTCVRVYKLKGGRRLQEVPPELFSPILREERQLLGGGGGGRWEFALDAFDPVAHFKRTFVHAPELAKLEKSKTKEQWSVVVKAVGFVTEELLADAEVAQRLADILCAVWSNHEAWAARCTMFATKLLRAAALWERRAAGAQTSEQQTPNPGEVLVNFTLKCPHEYFLSNATSKKDWVVSLLNASGPTAKEVGTADETLSLLFAAHGSGSAEELVELVHASGAEEVCSETERLLFAQLLPTWRAADGGKGKGEGEGRALVEQVRVLLRCRFKARWSVRGEERRAECVEWGGAEFWEELEREGAGAGGGGAGELGFAVVSEAEGAVETEAVVQAEAESRRRVQYDAASSVYRRFGERGEEVVVALLQRATAEDLLGLFREFGSEAVGSFLCGGPEDLLLKHWRPKECGAEEAAGMVELVGQHAPQLWARCSQLVWGQAALEVTEANSALMRALLRGRVPELGILPQRWWHCVDVTTLAHHCVATLQDQTPLQRLARAAVPVELSLLRSFFAGASLSVETQGLLLDAYASDAARLAEYVPLYSGPILGYLERLFRLLDEDAATAERLVEAGDGVGEEERQASGWNKVVNLLLTGLRTRSREGNWLHTEEQLAVVAYCCDKTRGEAPQEEGGRFPKWLLSAGNCAVLADLLEAASVDPRHLAGAVNLVLCSARPQPVRDAALRAMVRLREGEREALIGRLLSAPQRLPLGVLFALAVSQLSEAAAAVVVEKLRMLPGAELDALLDLIRDANPAPADRLHTFPRRPAVQRHLAERLLLRFVAGDPPPPSTQPRAPALGKEPPRRTRDPRFFLLFLACCPPGRAPAYILDLLDRQLLEVTPLLLSAFELRRSEPRPDDAAADAEGSGPPGSPERGVREEEWEVLLGHMGHGRLEGFLPWLWREVLARRAEGEGLVLLGLVLKHAVEGGAKVACAALRGVVEWGEGEEEGWRAGEVLRRVRGATEEVRGRLLAVTRGEGGGARVSEGEAQGLWVSYLARRWALEERGAATGRKEVLEARGRELAEALPELVVEELRGAAGRREGRPQSAWWDQGAAERVLAGAAVRRLGVDLEARVLLAEVAPRVALEAWLPAILQQDPAFAAALPDPDYQRCLAAPRSPLQPSPDDQAWPLLRRVLAALLAARRWDRALPLAIALASRTAQAQDVDAVEAAYRGAGAQQRRQTKLRAQLRHLWPQFGGALQAVVDAAAKEEGGRSAAARWELGEGVLERMDLVD